MFGDGRLEGWTRFFPSFREDLLFLMDDSWDIPCGTHEGNERYMGECRLDPGRFPTCTGTPVERLRKLVKKTKDIPCAVGFGISTPEQAAGMAAISDGIIVGSAIVKLCARYGKDCVEPIGEYVRSMKAAIR